MAIDSPSRVDDAGWSLLAARKMLPPRALHELATVDGRRTAWAIARQWAVIAAAAAFAVLAGAWWAYLPAIVVIASRQHALLVLVHDGAHGLLARRPRLNDAVSDVLLAFPVWVSTALYRRHHLLHHRFLNSEDDPDLAEARERHERPRWLALFASDITGLSLLKLLRSGSHFSMVATVTGGPEMRAAVAGWQKLAFAALWAATAAVLTVAGAWVPFLLLWALPLLTVLNFILRVRAVAEHAGCAPTPTIEGTRTVLPGRAERWLFAPVNINYHLAHHLFPGVPAPNLARLHAQLSECDDFRERAHITRGYLVGRSSVLNEVSTEPSR